MVERGTLRCEYDIQIDLEPIVDELMDVLGGYHYSYSFDGDGEFLRISAKGETPYKHYHSPATILDPPEDEYVADTIEGIDLKTAILEALHRLERVHVSAEMLDEEYEPDREDD